MFSTDPKIHTRQNSTFIANVTDQWAWLSSSSWFKVISELPREKTKNIFSWLFAFWRRLHRFIFCGRWPDASNTFLGAHIFAFGAKFYSEVILTHSLGNANKNLFELSPSMPWIRAFLVAFDYKTWEIDIVDTTKMYLVFYSIPVPVQTFRYWAIWSLSPLMYWQKLKSAHFQGLLLHSQSFSLDWNVSFG